MNRRQGRLPTIAIVGLGNWGTSLAHALLAVGSEPEEIVVPSGKARKAPASEWASLCVTMSRARLTADVFWLCVPDAAIARVTHQLVRRAVAQNGITGRIVVHSSGALSSAVLDEAAQAGAAAASVHPVMTFPTRAPVSLQGVPFGVEADTSTRRMLNRLIRSVGGRPFPVETSAKALYHAVGTLISPLLVSHLVAAQQAAALAGFTPREVRGFIEPIARATLENSFSHGPAKSFSGPIARGDVETIRLHLQALQPHPMLAEVYRSLARYALDTLPSSNRKGLKRLLR
jgi:predicted short-subunit dehydrogenase-like oxidoreductase (DUF2520 family)